MAILAECPRCHKKQAVKNRNCDCGADLVKEKRLQKVRYWVNYRLPNGKQRREAVGYLIEEARAAEGKRKAQKYENPGILEKVPAEKMTFAELIDWYLKLKSVQKLASFKRVKGALANFNRVFGDRVVSSIRPVDLEDYQYQREEEGKAPATIDMEICIAKTMVTKAFDNDLVDGRTVKAFRGVKRRLKKAANARKRTLSVQEYLQICRVAPPHLKAIITMAYNTGMRLGEIRNLEWGHIDRGNGLIRLPAELTKESKPKIIPLNHHVKKVLAELPRAIHHDFVFTYMNKPITGEGGVKKSFKTACNKAGVSFGRDLEGGIIFHDIRRTVKTNMLNAGVDKIHRDIILGHSLHGMDVHYMAPSKDDLHRAMARYTDWLDGQLNLQSVDQNVDQNMEKGQPT
jgi:integrase